MEKKLILDGMRFADLAGFYTEIYGLMTLYPDWEPGPSLDALNDMLYTGFGKEPVCLVWQHSDKSRMDLGVEATKAFYQKKLDRGKPYNIKWAGQKLRELETGNGQTLFEIILEIFGEHSQIILILD